MKKLRLLVVGCGKEEAPKQQAEAKAAVKAINIKNLILACLPVVILLSAGCGKSESERLKEKREQMERDIEKLEKAHKALKDLNDAKRRNDP